MGAPWSASLVTVIGYAFLACRLRRSADAACVAGGLGRKTKRRTGAGPWVCGALTSERGHVHGARSSPLFRRASVSVPFGSATGSRKSLRRLTLVSVWLSISRVRTMVFVMVDSFLLRGFW